MSYATTWLNFKDITLSEISRHKDKYFMIPLLWSTERSQTPRSRKWKSSYLGLRGKERGRCCSTGMEFEIWRSSGDISQHYAPVARMNTNEMVQMINFMFFPHSKKNETLYMSAYTDTYMYTHTDIHIYVSLLIHLIHWQKKITLHWKYSFKKVLGFFLKFIHSLIHTFIYF